MHHNQFDASALYGENRLKRYFLGFFKKKKLYIRPGAISSEELKTLVNEIGKGKKVNIVRIEYDGTPEDKPVSVKIVDIREDYFTGVVVNLERSIKQEMDEKLIYVKGGGGTIDFYFNDGDIKSIEQDIDESILEPKDPEELLEILDALDLDEAILLSFYDRDKGGVMNATGKLVGKDIENRTFKVELNLINDIELDVPKTISLDLTKDTVLDLEVVI